jgi:hypothetical protein
LHLRYRVDHDFLSPEVGSEGMTFGLSVGAFFRWEFHSFAVIVRDGVCWPIDFANATPDMALISLHYYFPWALCALAKWCLYWAVSGRAMRLDTEMSAWPSTSPATSSTPTWSPPSNTPSRPTSMSSSWPTTGGCSGAWVNDQQATAGQP